MNIQRSISYLQRTENLILPHGYMPGSYKGGVVSEYNEFTWEIYDWDNVNNAYGKLSKDKKASLKPSWIDLINADIRAETEELILTHIDILKREANGRINIAYNIKRGDNEKEIYLRLRNEHTSEQDIERARLHAVYKEQKLYVLSINLEVLQKYKPKSDKIWAIKPTEPINLDFNYYDGMLYLEAYVEYNGNSNIKKWQYRYRIGNKYNVWTNINNSASNSLSVGIDNITPNTTYIIQVRAVNIKGASLPSTEKSVSTHSQGE